MTSTRQTFIHSENVSEGTSDKCSTPFKLMMKETLKTKTLAGLKFLDWKSHHNQEWTNIDFNLSYLLLCHYIFIHPPWKRFPRYYASLLLIRFVMVFRRKTRRTQRPYWDVLNYYQPISFNKIPRAVWGSIFKVLNNCNTPIKIGHIFMIDYAIAHTPFSVQDTLTFQYAWHLELPKCLTLVSDLQNHLFCSGFHWSIDAIRFSIF